MKKILMIFLVAIMVPALMKAVPNRKIAGAALAKYTIVYDTKAEDEEGKNLAENLQKKLQQITGVQIPVATSDKVKGGKTISFIHTPSMKVWNYSAKATKNGVVIDGGGCWAMQKAADIMTEQLKKKDIPASFTIQGSVEGQVLFPRRNDVNLRILDDNIWDYSAETIPDVWKKAGIDCRDDARAPEFAQLMRAYMPDVITLQEYNNHMHVRLFPMLQKYGYEMANDPTVEPWAHTPIMYNKDNVELIEARNILFTPSQWSNHGSKSYTFAVMKQKSTGKTFAVLNTHLWWKGDNAQAGSTYARAAQIRLIMAEAEVIKAKYKCTIFVTGDMNCEEPGLAIQQFVAGGYIPCYKAATVYGNTDNGHHQCAPGTVGNRVSNRKGAQREVGAIDHCFIYNAQEGAEVKIFDCIQTFFTVKLTDHYPNLIDAKL